METFVSYFAPIFGISLYVFMCVSGLYKGRGIFNTYYSKACYRARHSSWIWPALGISCQIVAMVIFCLMALEKIDVSMGMTILGGFFIALGWAAFGGFDFTILPEDDV